jgi:predicted DNA-binding transcriptional regulator YafY
MGRADDIQKAERLNQARQLLGEFDHLPDAVQKMVRDCRVSPRQAYRYLQQARLLKQPVVVGDPKVAFTVKLSQTLVERVRSHASVSGLSLSEIVSRALAALLARRRGRG